MSDVTPETTVESTITGTTKVDTITSTTGEKRILTWIWSDTQRVLIKVEQYKVDGTISHSWVLPNP